MRLGEATWTDVEHARGHTADGTLRPVVLIPTGSIEQHGPHLPLNTDTLIAQELAARALSRTDGLALGPTIAIGASGEHAGFAGTLSIGTPALTTVAVELCRSADWAAGVVFVNAHGGNHEALHNAIDLVTDEGRRATVWSPRWPQRADGGPPDLHAGRIETSLMLAIDPGLVRLEHAAAGAATTIDELRERGVAAVSPSGVLGDPTGASGGEGDEFIAAFVDDLLLHVERWRPVTLNPE
ncbi:MAG: mycofactocin biosynthesis peptidyl-dipeptidase MftE [Actinomycetota bacterium]